MKTLGQVREWDTLGHLITKITATQCTEAEVGWYRLRTLLGNQSEFLNSSHAFGPMSRSPLRIEDQTGVEACRILKR